MDGLLCTRSRAAGALVGAVLLLGAAGLGALGARGAGLLRDTLAGSEIISRFFGRESSQPDWLTGLFSDPESAGLFLRYLNALAPATTSLSVTPKGEARQFEALLSSARSRDVRLLRFGYSPSENRLTVTCETGLAQNALDFCSDLEFSDVFSKIYPPSLPENFGTNSQQFTIFCDL